MADVFISYARVDRQTAEAVRDLLETAGLSVFLDIDRLEGGDPFPEVLDVEVRTAGAVLAIWTPHALTRPWVRAECHIAKESGRLVATCIEPLGLMETPAAFVGVNLIDLTDFDGGPGSVGWRLVMRGLSTRLKRPDLADSRTAHTKAVAQELIAEMLPHLRAAGFVREAERRGLGNEQMAMVLERFGLEGIPEAHWGEALLASADRLREVEERLKSLSNVEPEIAGLLAQAGAAIEAAAFDKADDLLAEAERRDLEAGAERLRRASASRERRGDLARGAGRYLEAADHYAEAARIVQPYDLYDWARLKTEEGGVSAEKGGYDLDPSHLERALKAYRVALEVYPRDEAAEKWAATQMLVGNALQVLGERGDIPSLWQAVRAYNAALEVYTRERAPLDWAMAQNNLGNALMELGERR